MFLRIFKLILALLFVMPQVSYAERVNQFAQIRQNMHSMLLERANALDIGFKITSVVDAKNPKETVSNIVLTMPNSNQQFVIDSTLIEGIAKNLIIYDPLDENLQTKRVFAEKEMVDFHAFTGELITNNISEARKEYLIKRIDQTVQSIGRKILAYTSTWNADAAKTELNKKAEGAIERMLAFDGTRYLGALNIVAGLTLVGTLQYLASNSYYTPDFFKSGMTIFAALWTVVGMHIALDSHIKVKIFKDKLNQVEIALQNFNRDKVDKAPVYEKVEYLVSNLLIRQKMKCSYFFF